MSGSATAAQGPFRSDTEVGLFPTFFMAGFECSTFVWKDGQRKDYVALTGHDRELESDYRRLSELGIGVVREAVRWPLVDQGQGRYDWSTVDPFLDALRRHNLSPIWDLCHYGFPDGFDPFDRGAPAALRRLLPRRRGVPGRPARRGRASSRPSTRSPSSPPPARTWAGCTPSPRASTPR